MSKKGRSEPNLFGGYTHYDEKGRKVGRSEPNLFGGYTNYDAKGKKIGRSDPNLFGGYTQRDLKGRKVGSSDPNLFGGYTHRDAKGHKVGTSDPKLTGGYKNYSNQQGCYIATCVYGSYDCPEVWTLRRFRDQKLAMNAAGLMFIRMYYTVSPKLVRLFGNTRWFKIIWRQCLDPFVKRLQRDGISSEPYADIDYRKGVNGR